MNHKYTSYRLTIPLFIFILASVIVLLFPRTLMACQQNSDCNYTHTACNDPSPGCSASQCSGNIYVYSGNTCNLATGTCTTNHTDTPYTCADPCPCPLGPQPTAIPTPTVTPIPIPTNTPTPSPTSTPSPTPIPTFTIQGQVYVRTTGNSQNCAYDPTTDDLLTVSSVFTDMNIRIPNHLPTIYTSQGRYTFSNIPGTNNTINISSNNPAGTYNVLCSVKPVTGSTSGGTVIAPPYILLQNRLPWWQSAGGDIHAGVNLVNKVPASCTVASGCQPLLTRLINTSMLQSSGVGTFGGYSSDYGQAFGPSGRNFLANSASPLPESFSYFENLLRNELSCISPTAVDNFLSPGFYRVCDSNGNLTSLTINDEWDVGTKKIVLLVYNLTVNEEIEVDTDNSGFLMIVAQGSINFAGTVGYSAYTVEAPNVTGVYFSDTSISVLAGPNPQNKFVGSGNFISRNGNISLNRDLPDDNNNTNPAHLFLYNPKLVLNAPEELMYRRNLWQEIAPFRP